MPVSDYLKESSAITPLVLGARNTEHVQCFIDGLSTHALALRGTHDAHYDEVVPTTAREPNGSSEVSAQLNSHSREVQANVSRFELHGRTMLRVISDCSIKEQHSFVGNLGWDMQIMVTKLFL